MHEQPNALMAISEELRRVEALVALRPLDPDDTELYVLITRARDEGSRPLASRAHEAVS